MEPLFEAKALVSEKYAMYHIYRISTRKYRAELILDEDGSTNGAAPTELIITKTEASWQTDNSDFEEIGVTLGTEIDVFNNGYGAILGRIDFN